MPLAFPPRRLRLPERAIQVILALLFLAHLAQGLARARLFRLARGGAARAALAGEFLGALPVLFEHEIGRFLARERVLAEVLIPARAPFLERFVQKFLVARAREVVALDAFVERGPELLLLGGFRGLLLALGALALLFCELGFHRLELLPQIGRGHAVFRGIPDVAGDLRELVTEQPLQHLRRAAIVLALIGCARLGKGPVLARDRCIDAVVFRLLLAMLALALLELGDLRLVPFERLGEVLVALDLVELRQARALLGRGLFLGRVFLCRLIVLGIGVLVVVLFGLFLGRGLAVERAPARFQGPGEVLAAFLRLLLLRRLARGFARRARGGLRLRGVRRDWGLRVLRLRVRRFRYFRVLVLHCSLLGKSGSRRPWR